MLLTLKLWSILAITLLRLFRDGVISEASLDPPVGFVQPRSLEVAPGMFGVGQNLSMASVTGFTVPPPATIAASSAATWAGSGTQASVTNPTGSRCPS